MLRFFGVYKAPTGPLHDWSRWEPAEWDVPDYDSPVRWVYDKKVVDKEGKAMDGSAGPGWQEARQEHTERERLQIRRCERCGFQQIEIVSIGSEPDYPNGRCDIAYARMSKQEEEK